MTAIELWMKWQAEGTPVPMVVCECAMTWLRFARYQAIWVDAGGGVRSSSEIDPYRIDVVIPTAKDRERLGIVFTRHAPECLRRWGYFLVRYDRPTVEGRWTEKAKLDPETIEWARGWQP